MNLSQREDNMLIKASDMICSGIPEHVIISTLKRGFAASEIEVKSILKKARNDNSDIKTNPTLKKNS